MRPPLLEELAAGLESRRAAGLERRLELPTGLDFASNDYLGLAHDPSFVTEVVRRMSGADDAEPWLAPASRLLRGTTARHLAFEARFAAWKGAEAALLLPSGYQANLALITALVGPDDRVLSDALNHASLIDAVRLARPVARVIFPHGDVNAVARALAEPFPGGRTFLITESLFSMDGDLAPLDRYAELTAAHGAELLVDEAHATGLYGDRGSGRVEELGLDGAVTAVVSTFGKSLGLAGGAITGARVLIDHLVNRSRPFIFSTAVPPLTLVALETALDRVAEEPWRRHRVLALAARLRAGLAAGGITTGGERSPIVPLVVGANEPALALAETLAASGFDARAVRPPTVPAGTARLRLSVHAHHEEAEIDALVAAIVEARAA